MPSPTSGERLSRIEGAVERIGKTVDGIDLLLRGNGQTGLVTRVDRLEQSRKGWGRWREKLWAVALLAIGAILACVLGGCISPAKQLASRLADAQQGVVSARQSVQDARSGAEAALGTLEASHEAKPLLTDVLSDLDAADGHLARVAKTATGAQTALTGVEDKGNWFTNMTGDAGDVIKLALGAIVVVGLCIVGLWLFRRFGYLLPRKVKTEAQMWAKVRDENDPMTARELESMRREAEPLLNVAAKRIRPPPAT